MKKIVAYCLMVLTISFMFFGCQKKKHTSVQHPFYEWVHPSKKIKILSTTAVIDDLIGRIGQEHILHRALIKRQLDPHSYELVKGDDALLAFADRIFYNGLGLEHGASLKYCLEKDEKAYSLGDFVQKKELIFSEGQVDPHIWMDVQLFSSVVKPIVKCLSEADPDHAEVFKENGEALLKEMEELHKAIHNKMKKIPKEQRYLITSHDAFFYFARRYLAEPSEVEGTLWRQRFAAPEGLAPDGQISPRDIQVIVEYAIHHGVKVIFPESNLSQDALKKVISVLHQKGVKTCLAKDSLYGDVMGDQGSGADSYLKMMEHNAEIIALHLGERKHE